MSRKAYPKADTLSRKRRARDGFVVTSSREAGRPGTHARRRSPSQVSASFLSPAQVLGAIAPFAANRSVVPRPGPSHCCSPVALWSQCSSFFWKMNTGTIYMVSPACSRVTMSPNYIGWRPTYGAQYDSENCTRCGEKRAANLSTSTPTWRCCNRPGARDHVFFPWCVGR